jgi:hypothetical protein
LTRTRRVCRSGKPQYEQAYFDGGTVRINAIEVPQNSGPLTQAAADLYETVYPPDTTHRLEGRLAATQAASLPR